MFFNLNIFVLHTIKDECIEGEVYFLALISNLKKAFKLGYNVSEGATRILFCIKCQVMSFNGNLALFFRIIYIR